jgi:hypothetical protein
MLNTLKRKAIKLAKDDSKYERIVEILQDENAFIKMDVNAAIAILLDLGYDTHEAMKLYIELTSRK